MRKEIFHKTFLFIKSLSLFTAFLILEVFIAALPAMAQGNIETFFGPEDFYRGKGEPATEIVQLGTTGHEAPFIFHLRNGDENGSHRVSSTWVWLNDQLILSPSNFNQQVFDYSFEVPLSDPSVIKVKAGGTPGGKLTIWIEGVNRNIRKVGPEGGTLEFSNGVILDIPPGAVTETVDIEITDLPCDEVDAIISSQALATPKKRCLRGFSGRPDGFVFNVPIKATVPVALQPGDIPFQIGVDVNNNVQWPIETELIYRGGNGVVEMSLQHFSEEWLAALLNYIDDTCKVCSTYSPEVCGPLASPHPFFDYLQPGACLLLAAEREEHDCKVEGLKCCMEELMEVKVTDVDFVTGECQIAGGKVNVTFPHCDGTPTYTYDEAESSGCPKDAIYKINIVSDQPWIYRCQTATLKAELSAKTKDGITLFQAKAFPAEWYILPGGVTGELGQDIGSNGKIVTGLEEGDLLVHAEAVGRNDISGDFALPVKKIPFAISPPGDLTINVGADTELWVPCFACPEGVTWSTDNPAVVSLTILPGDSVRVTGIERGTAKVCAHSLDHCRLPIEDCLTVEVKKKEVIVTPDQATIRICDTKQLTATVIDIEDCTLVWDSSKPDVAVVDATGLVTPIHGGKTDIKAVCGDSMGVATITVKGFAGEWDTNWGGLNTPMSITVSEGLATGTYYFDSIIPVCPDRVDGTIDGNLSGHGCILTGTWSDYGKWAVITRPDGTQLIQCNLLESGTINFHLSPDGDSFTGSWTQVCEHGNCGGSWNGVRRP